MKYLDLVVRETFATTLVFGFRAKGVEDEKLVRSHEKMVKAFLDAGLLTQCNFQISKSGGS